MNEDRGSEVRQQGFPVVYKGIQLETAFRADLIVGDKVIVEIKSIEAVAQVHKKQLINLPAPGQQTPRPADRLQRSPNQGQHHANRERHARLSLSLRSFLSGLCENS